MKLTIQLRQLLTSGRREALPLRLRLHVKMLTQSGDSAFSFHIFLYCEHATEYN
jgi:hypothetical protein